MRFGTYCKSVVILAWMLAAATLLAILPDVRAADGDKSRMPNTSYLAGADTRTMAGDNFAISAAVGDIAADFTLQEWFTRQPMSLYGDFAGKIVLLDFSAWWCPPCQVAASELEPYIQEYYAVRGGNPDGIPVQVIFMNVDTSGNTAQTTAFIQQYGIDLALDDTSLTIYNRFGSGYIPVFVIINGVAHANYDQWEVLYLRTGYTPGSYAGMRSVINSVVSIPDSDGDGFVDPADNCPEIANPGQEDAEADGVGDACDNCVDTPNHDQTDTDGDGQGDACDDDIDDDGLLNGQDNCPFNVNPDQADADADSVGDVCDACPDTLPGLDIDPDGCPPPQPGDMDRDGDVDQSDFGLLQACLSGMGVPQTDPACTRAKLDTGDTVDRQDVLLFKQCRSGSRIPGDPDCTSP